MKNGSSTTINHEKNSESCFFKDQREISVKSVIEVIKSILKSICRILK